jgi:separase
MLFLSEANILASSSTYCEALGLSTNLSGEDKGMSTAQRVKARVGSLERAAIAAHTYGVIQYARVSGLFRL